MFLDILCFFGRMIYGVFAFVIILILTIIEGLLRFFAAIGTVVVVKISGLIAMLATFILLASLISGNINEIVDWKHIVLTYGIAAGFFVVALVANVILEVIGSALDKLKSIIQRN